jgi:hypothetical protein
MLTMEAWKLKMESGVSVKQRSQIPIHLMMRQNPDPH